MTAQTLYDKLWQSHVVHEEADGTVLLYIDRHLIHEVTSPQAFEGLKLAGRQPWRVGSIVATADHNTPTDNWDKGIQDPISRQQVETLDANIREVGARAYFPFKDQGQGVIHVMGPEQGATLPGMTVVCGDSHTSTHGALGCLAHGIGTSEVEHVLATQTLVAKKSKSMLIAVEGELGAGVSAKDVALAIIGKIGTAGGTGYAIEFAGSAIRGLTVEGRMTLCNMAIEMGAKAGLVAPDETTFNYVKGRLHAPKGQNFDDAVAYWKTLKTDDGATFDTVVTLQAEEIAPQVTWGTSPGQVISVNEMIPDPASFADPVERASAEKALAAYAQNIQQAKAKLAGQQGQTVSVTRWTANGPIYMYKDSFASQVLSDLGLARPAQQQQAGASHSAPISRERYDQIDAGWIIIGSSLPPEQQLNELNKFPEFKRLQAVKNNQYFAVDASMWTGVGGPNAANQAVADVLAHMPKS